MNIAFVITLLVVTGVLLVFGLIIGSVIKTRKHIAQLEARARALAPKAKSELPSRVSTKRKHVMAFKT